MSPRLLTSFVDLGGQWHITLFCGTLACAAHLIWARKKRSGALAAIFWIYAVGSALFLVEYPALPFGAVNTAFQAQAGQTLAELLLIPLAVLSVPRKIWQAVPVLALIEIALVWFHGSGLMGHDSFDNALIALCLPFVGPVVAILSLVTITSHHGSTAILMALIVEFVLIWSWAAKTDNQNRARLAGITATAILAILPVALYFRGHDLLLGAPERFAAYHRYMGFWSHSLQNILIGTGPGTFMWCSLAIDRFQAPAFLAMHSEWLQVMFELGFIGWALMLAVFIQAIRGAKKPQVLAGVLAAGVFALTYHPFRFFPSAFLIALIVREALENKKG